MLLRDVDRRFNSVAIKNHPFFKSVGNVSKGAVKKVFDPMVTFKMRNGTPTAAPNLVNTSTKEEEEIKAKARDAARDEELARIISRYSSGTSEARLRTRWERMAPTPSSVL
jgi:hypothetical protein